MHAVQDHAITTEAALRDLYGEPVERARIKVIDHVDQHLSLIHI